MKVLITGVNGFIANHLAKLLNEHDCEVYGTSSKEIKNSYCIDTYKVTLKELLFDVEIVFDWVIHMTYSQIDSVEDNINFTIAMAEKFQQSGVKNQIFFSSISAVSSNNSDYAEIKRKTEKWFIDNNMYVVRPGLVVGDGGLFLQMVKKVKYFPIIPLVNGGKTKIKLIGIYDLLDEIKNIIYVTPNCKELNLFYKNEISLKYLLEKIAFYLGKKRFFVLIPFFLIYYVVKIFEVLHIHIGITSENVVGLKANDMKIMSYIKYEKDILKVLKESGV